MTKKTFNNSYSELYLITKEVYHKVMDNITNRSDKDETIELNENNNWNEDENNVDEEVKNYLPVLDEAKTNSDYPLESATEKDSNSTIMKDIVNKIDDLKKIVIQDVNQKTSQGTQTQATQLSSKETETMPVSSVDNSTQIDLVNQNTIGTQTRQPLMPTPDSVSKGTDPILASSVDKSTQIAPPTHQPHSEPPMFASQGTSTTTPFKMQSFFCEICSPPKSFTTNYSKKRHIENKHPESTYQNTSKKRKYDVEDEDQIGSYKKQIGDIAGKRKLMIDDGNTNNKKMRTDAFSGKRKRASNDNDRGFNKRLKSLNDFRRW